MSFTYFSKFEKNEYGDECANVRCRGGKAVKYNVRDKNWYCHWCAMQINQDSTKVDAEGNKVQLCIPKETATWLALTNQL